MKVNSYLFNYFAMHYLCHIYVSRNMLLSRNPEIRTAPSTVLLYGETYARQTNWEQSLEVCESNTLFL